MNELQGLQLNGVFAEWIAAVRAKGMPYVGLAGRGTAPLVFSTEFSATFVDADDTAAAAVPVGEVNVNALNFSTSEANTRLRRRSKQTLPGIINVRTDGRVIDAARRVQASYQWESYGPIVPA